MTDQIFYTEGAGNTFLFTLSNSISFRDLAAVAKKEGLSPDGFIVSKKIDDHMLTFSFYNKDGSGVDFCGNALRAVGVCYYKISKIKKFKLATNVGDLNIDVKSSNVIEAQMPRPQDQGVLEIEGHKVPHILSGVPHLVFDQDKFDLKNQEEIKNFSLKVRRLNLGGAETYNLSFYKGDTEPVECVTFERGVEDFTLACGSGALSVAYVVGGDEVSLKMPGGLLEVSRHKEDVLMLGPASIIEIY